MVPRALRAMMVLGVAGRCVVGAVPAVAQTPASGESDANASATTAAPPVREDARRLHTEALASFRAGEFQKAYAGFIEAWNLQGLPRIPRIAGNLGRAELKVGKHR